MASTSLVVVALVIGCYGNYLGMAATTQTSKHKFLGNYSVLHSIIAFGALQRRGFIERETHTYPVLHHYSYHRLQYE